MATNAIIGWLIGAAVVLGGGYFFITQNSSSDTMMQKDVATQGAPADEKMMATTSDAIMEDKKPDDAMMEKDSMKKGEALRGDTMMKKGVYETYEASKLAMADSGDVVLFFRASWCPTCKALDADIRTHLNAIPADLSILDVDYDNSSELKKKYGVTYQHTFVQVDSRGTLIKKWSGSPTLAALVAEAR